MTDREFIKNVVIGLIEEKINGKIRGEISRINSFALLQTILDTAYLHIEDNPED